jgi:hypothetical protein
MLSLNQVHNVCFGDISKTSSQCRYLEQDDLDNSKYYCLKMITLKKSQIDKDVEDFLVKSKSKGFNPYLENVPLGDNCSGFIKLKNVVQGYDVK